MKVFSSNVAMVVMLIFLIDRLSKYIAHEMCPCIVGPFLNIMLHKNEGIALGMFSEVASANTIFTLVTIAIIGVLAYLLSTVKESYMRVGLAMMLGGALGNLFDRIVYGAVIDFLRFHIRIWNFPVFNFADAAITIGAVLIIIGTFIAEGKAKKIKSSS